VAKWVLIMANLTLMGFTEAAPAWTNKTMLHDEERITGVYDGWCTNWQQLTGDGSFFTGLTESQCWAKCRDNSNCFQAVHEASVNYDGTNRQCWLGGNHMTAVPTGWNRGDDVVDKCYGKTPETPSGLPDTDYMALLGEDEVAGKRQAFMAENRVFYLSDDDRGDTIGLLHPYFHDLRSRGTTIASSGDAPQAGVGNDYSGWEWWRGTKVAAGSIVDTEKVMPWGEYMRWDIPKPTRTWWRPDKITHEYDLGNPFMSGISSGFCDTGKNSRYFGWGTFASAQQCFHNCSVDARCYTAVFEVDDQNHTQCWQGSDRLPLGTTSGMRCPTCNDTCWSKPVDVENITIREEKFIALNEVASSIISTDRSVRLEVNGRSWTPSSLTGAGPDAGTIISQNSLCEPKSNGNIVHVQEFGSAQAQLLSSGDFVEGPLMYNGMHAAITASVPLEDLSFSHNVTMPNEPQPRQGVCAYNFSLALSSAHPVTLSWAMSDDYSAAEAVVLKVVDDAATYMKAKTKSVNDRLNNVVPYFRCSDRDIVKVYYYLWSLYTMLYLDNNKGIDRLPHTQSAANNFLGMHRYDAVMQIPVGAWTNPAYHDFYANGNLLVWESVLNHENGQLVNGNQLPDNFGLTWGSAIYGGEAAAHIPAACDIYRHSGDKQFLSRAYAFYKKLFFDDHFWITGTWNYNYESVVCIVQMAELLGHNNDTATWKEATGYNFFVSDYNQDQLKAQWDNATMYDLSNPASGNFGWSTVAALLPETTHRTWVQKLADSWMVDDVEGFFDIIPLATKAMKNYHSDDNTTTGLPKCPMGPGCTGKGLDSHFSIVPDGNYFTIRPFYRHKVSGFANKAFLAHLKRYQMNAGIAVAPEAYDYDNNQFGNQFNNFNAGKIQLFLEGLLGVRVDNFDDSFTFADNLPANWTFMEVRVPVKRAGQVSWVKARSERTQDGNTVTKQVSVEDNPFKTLHLQPWSEDAKVLSFTPGGVPGVANDESADGHMNWSFGPADGHLNNTAATVQLVMDYGTAKWDGTEWDGSLAAQGRLLKARNYTACDPMGGTGPLHCVGSPQGSIKSH